MSDNINSKVWLIGAGAMAIEYVKVMKHQGIEFEVVGRGVQSANKFTEKTGIEVKIGDLTEQLSHCQQIPNTAIVAVGVDQLAKVTLLLLQRGVKKILVEKPAGLNLEQIHQIVVETKKNQADVYVGYNRRFYASVLEAKKIIEADGGVKSFTFEFTEWSHVIEKLETNACVKENWFLANSTHVVDLAFYLGGLPKEITCYTDGQLHWHPAASIFAGAGVTEIGALFSYQANWEAPGRWGIEVLTKQHRLIFRPIEQLHIQKIGSVNIEKVEINDSLDCDFKPGLYRQVEAFLDEKTAKMLLTIQQQEDMVNKVYRPIVSTQ